MVAYCCVYDEVASTLTAKRPGSRPSPALVNQVWHNMLHNVNVSGHTLTLFVLVDAGLLCSR